MSTQKVPRTVVYFPDEESEKMFCAWEQEKELAGLNEGVSPVLLDYDRRQKEKALKRAEKEKKEKEELERFQEKQNHWFWWPLPLWFLAWWVIWFFVILPHLR